MKLITRDTDYAIRAIVYIAKSDKKLVCVSEIEQELGLPKPFLRRILQKLHKKGILQSIKGNKGGFSLAVPPKKLSFADIITTLQGPISLTECYLKKEICPNIKKCAVRKKIKNIEKVLIQSLKNITIFSLREV